MINEIYRNSFSHFRLLALHFTSLHVEQSFITEVWDCGRISTFCINPWFLFPLPSCFLHNKNTVVFMWLSLSLSLKYDSANCWSGPCVAWITKPNYSSKPNTSSIRKPNSTRIIIASISRPIYIYIYILGLWYLASSEN